ncbi:MAPEG family protein [Aquabacterium sp.]|uniref:MAPEG family protein n=1 Tax=Aquabacterium sp. TaxID=1872578 RepID=UPI002C85FCC7|nr:MAPEG family protein [Aquabacterium sp.]HSW06323.1 MAPEG family protein [Aquabacterium sp.]
MNRTLTLVVCMAIVTWLTVLVASLLRAKAWTPAGLMMAFGNRADLPEATGFAGRAERTARNTMENFVLFAAIALVAQASGSTHPNIATGATVFFWARLVYIPVYYAGITFVRTGVWLVSIVGLGMMVLALF